jgi:hypothetical protein
MKRQTGAGDVGQREAEHDGAEARPAVPLGLLDDVDGELSPGAAFAY